MSKTGTILSKKLRKLTNEFNKLECKFEKDKMSTIVNHIMKDIGDSEELKITITGYGDSAIINDNDYDLEDQRYDDEDEPFMFGVLENILKEHKSLKKFHIDVVESFIEFLSEPRDYEIYFEVDINIVSSDTLNFSDKNGKGEVTFKIKKSKIKKIKNKKKSNKLEVNPWLFPVTQAIVDSDYDLIKECIEQGAPVKEFHSAIFDALYQFKNNNRNTNILCLLLDNGCEMCQEDDRETIEWMSEEFPELKKYL